MQSSEIREKFLKFFESKGHTRVKSSSLIPAADPTLLFTNAGMVQFKDCFLGLQDLGFRRATTSQKCVRAGGKHNDLENVGFTARHHTFFEMLGNFSFGDYFKKDAIAFAWELITVHFKIPKEKLRVTVFEKDDEAFELWKAQGVRPDWIGRLGETDNFWAMGDTGPCGPCTEIYYDWGEKYGCGKPTCAPGCECGTRFLEIWNLVFMQFNRDSAGNLTPLPKPSVDTGAGLERVTAVLQGIYNNYDTDIFAGIFRALEKICGKKYGAEESFTTSMRVIGDHIRSGVFLIADGVNPSNEGRGYVLRRILRRAVRHGKNLGMDKPFLYQLVGAVSETFGTVYPELTQKKSQIEVILREEEERFHETLHRGMGLLEETMVSLKKKSQKLIPGEVAFKLYDTYGFPFDLIEVIAKENNLTVDKAEFETQMEKQRSQSVWNKAENSGLLEKMGKEIESSSIPETQFYGYDCLEKEGKLLKLFAEGNNYYAVFDATPFYAESGGQVGDKGKIEFSNGTAEVVNTFKLAKRFVHQLNFSGKPPKEGEKALLKVDSKLRMQTAINHTATHMMHAALRKVLGDRVKQAGSLVEPSRLRFDFTFSRAVSNEELQKVESLVQEEIFKGSPVVCNEMAYDDAIKSGAMAFFDEKYGDKVRVLSVGDKKNPFSVELCGGTHLTNTLQVSLFKIVSESSVASGVRRIEAITSSEALKFYEQRNQTLSSLESLMNLKNEAVVSRVDQLSQQNRNLQKEIETLKLKVIQGGTSSGGALHDKAITFPGKNIKAVIEQIDNADGNILRNLVDQIRDKLKERTVVMLVSHQESKVALCVGLTKDLVGEFQASKLIQPIAEMLGGKGGGRPDFAQAGGNKPEMISQALEEFKKSLK